MATLIVKPSPGITLPDGRSVTADRVGEDRIGGPVELTVLRRRRSQDVTITPVELQR